MLQIRLKAGQVPLKVPVSTRTNRPLRQPPSWQIDSRNSPPDSDPPCDPDGSSSARAASGGALKRRSPEGFVLDSANLQMLLPDGRLWSYSRSDAIRYPAGRYFDVRADHANFARGRSFFGGTGFAFLGAVIGKYTFGLGDHDGLDQASGTLCAICTEGKSIRYVDVTKALDDIAGGVVTRGETA